MARLLDTSIFGNLSVNGKIKHKNEDLVNIINRMANKEGVHSSSTSTAGSYIRFTNGDQIAWRLASSSGTTNKSTVEGYYTESNMTYPAAFSEVPVVGPLSLRVASVQWAGVRRVSQASTDIYLITTYNTYAVGKVGYVAFGRWK